MGRKIMKKVALTLSQWLIISLAAVAGVLAVVLKLQGDKLKDARVKLLEKDLEIAIQKDEQNIQAKKKKLREAKKQ
jgi:hypothetical protein